MTCAKLPKSARSGRNYDATIALKPVAYWRLGERYGTGVFDSASDAMHLPNRRSGPLHQPAGEADGYGKHARITRTARPDRECHQCHSESRPRRAKQARAEGCPLVRVLRIPCEQRQRSAESAERHGAVGKTKPRVRSAEPPKEHQ